jgi:ankyrin repeat protein
VVLCLQEGKTALHVAAERNEDADMVAYLVDSGVDINAADEVQLALLFDGPIAQTPM